MKIFTALLTLCALTLAQFSTASAATFNFQDYANGNEKGYSSYSVTEDDIRLTASGQHRTNEHGNKEHGNKEWVDAFAYLDSGDAGLGVCKSLNSSKQCTPSSDDNVTKKEKLILKFDQLVRLTEVNFLNGKHKDNFAADAKFNLKVDKTIYKNLSLTAVFLGGYVGEKFQFFNWNEDDDNDYQFYISTLNVSAVPVPAALFLFGPALIGLLGFRRKFQKV